MLGFPIYTRDKDSPRAYHWIWFVRIFQLVVTLVVLAITAANAASFGAITCSVPSKLAWNLACAVLALFALAYFLLSTGPGRLFKILPWWIIIQVALDALMFIFWLSAAATSDYDCNDLCNACPNLQGVFFDGLNCDCLGSDYYYYYKKRSMSPVPRSGLLQKRRSNGGSSSGSTAGAKKALDAIMTILFFATLVSSIAWIFQNRRASSSNTTTPAPGTNTNPEAGATQVPTEAKQDNSYYNPNNGAPPMQQGQLPMQQGNYGPVSPQAQYPPQQQGGYPPQQGGYPPQQQPQQPIAYYGGSQEGMQPMPQQPREMSPPMQQSPVQHQTPDYPTPTPEMQAERREI